MNSMEITTIFLSVLFIPLFIYVVFREDISKFYEKNIPQFKKLSKNERSFKFKKQIEGQNPRKRLRTKGT